MSRPERTRSFRLSTAVVARPHFVRSRLALPNDYKTPIALDLYTGPPATISIRNITLQTHVRRGAQRERCREISARRSGGCRFPGETRMVVCDPGDATAAYIVKET